MNYWLLTTEYPPFHGGGISTYCYFTARMMSGKGHAVTVFVPDNSIRDYTIEITQQITVVRFHTNRSKLDKTLGYITRLSYEFASIVKDVIAFKGKPDCIEAQDYLGIAYYLQQFKLTGCAALQDIPIVLTLHSPAFLYLEYNRVAIYKFPDYWVGEMEKQSIIAADALLSPTSFLYELLKKYINLPSKTVHVIPNPYEYNVDIVNSKFQRNEIVFFGKLSPQKGILKLLDYLKKIWDEGYNYCLELIGDTTIVYHPERQTMGRYIETKYHQYIQKGFLKLTGKIATDAITEKLQKAHVVIVPSIVDNLPYAVIEAMSRGKIVLASMQGGQREIIRHEWDGYVFDHEKENDFQEKLFRILSLSDTEILACGKHAVETIKHRYNFEEIYSQKVQVLNQLLAVRNTEAKFPFLHQENFAPLVEKNNALLSVVIPYFNMGDYIEECITTVLNSTYSPLEVLIINDGSTDKKSLVVLQKLSQLQAVKIINTENYGVAYARNFGASKAAGRFLAFLDADDKITPQYFEKAIHVLNSYTNVFFIGSWVQYFENSTSVWPAFTPQPPYALVHNPVNSSGLVYKTAAFLAAGRNDKEVDYGLEDYESVLALLQKGYNGVVLPECLFYYRVRSGSMIRGITKNKLLYSYKYITEKHSIYYSKFAPQIINLLNANGPGYSFDNPTMEQQSRLGRKIVSPVFDRLKNFVSKNPRLKKLILKMMRAGS